MRYHLHFLMAAGILFTLLAFQCEDECYVPRLQYSLALQVSDADNALALTDTLWLEAELDTSLTFENYNIIGSDCFLNVRVLWLDASAPTDGQAFEWVSADSSSFVRNAAASSPGAEQGTVSFTCSGYRCRFRAGLRPLAAGTYCLQILEGTFGSNYSRGGYDCNGKNQFIDNRITNVGATQQLIATLDTTVIGLPISTGQITQVDVTDTGSPYYVFEVR